MWRERIKLVALEIHPDVVRARRYLHAHPELSFLEHETSAYIKNRLTEIGIPWKATAGTGIVAMLEGKLASDNVIALRADIDALPILEKNNVDYASQNTGVMHACGHDFHSASLLGTAQILQSIRDSFGGRVKLIFQPGEEVLPGGASIMIKEGVLQNPTPSAIIGQHAMPRIEAGKIGIRSGKHMASMDAVKVRIIGKGGHGAEPHKNIDPIVIAAQIILALQQVVSRIAQPGEPTVLSFGKIIADGAVNVIPDEVYMEGTFRAMNETWRNVAHQRMKEIAEGIAASMGATCEFAIIKGYPFLVNEKKLTQKITQYAIEYVGEQNVLEEDIWMAAEDFAYYSQVADSCFYLCGVGNNAKGITSSLHTPTFDIDENALITSSGLMAYLAIRQLGN
jgi:amidohydrolase